MCSDRTSKMGAIALVQLNGDHCLKFEGAMADDEGELLACRLRSRFLWYDKAMVF